MSLLKYFKNVSNSNISKFLIRIHHEISVAAPGGTGGTLLPPKPGKFAKEGEQFTTQPAIRIDILKNFVKSFKIFIKFS